VSFSTKCLSPESLKVLMRWGCKPLASYTRATLMWLRPKCRASERVLQCVASFGELCRVVSTIRRLCSASSRRELGLRGGSCSIPGTPACTKRSRQRTTVGREVLSSRAICRLDRPSLANRQIRERKTIFCGVEGARTHAFNCRNCSSLIVKAVATSHMHQEYRPQVHCKEITVTLH